MMTKDAITPLKAARLERGLSLAKVADLAKVDRGNLSRLENRKIGASAEAAERLARVLGISELKILYPERFMRDQAA